MRSFSRSTLLLAFSLSLLAACGKSGTDAAGGANAGVVGTSFNVLVYRPAHGKVTSMDGRIHCGSAAADSACTADFGWSVEVTLTAAADAGYGFQTWAGDCQTAGVCTLSTAVYGADKYVLAVFAELGSVGHSNYTKQQDHAPAYFAYIGGKPGSIACPSCHGANLQGQGIAPDCFTCHAAAGWTDWRNNCSFCHGAKTPASQAGYTFATTPSWAAPPDAISQRLTGVAAPAKTGAHQAHLAGVTAGGVTFAAPFKCETCHPVPAAGHQHAVGDTAKVVLAGAGQASLPASLGTYTAANGTCSTYCHGPAAPVWSATGSVTCGSCHALPPANGIHPAVGSDPTICNACHGTTVKSDGTIDGAGGKHLNGTIDLTGGGAGCASCHGFPPKTGAHEAHFGIDAAAAGTGYGDMSILEDFYPLASPTSAPSTYAFGCGNCHPTDGSQHFNSVKNVVLSSTGAPAGSLKSLNAPTAAYNPTTGTCSGVYCHSSGQQNPAYVATPSWTSTTHLGCTGCHTNPPAYASDGPGAAKANGHVQLTVNGGYEWGHFLGLIGAQHSSQHGKTSTSGKDSSPITCQTCHFDTTDPANTGPSGFYYLDTTGNFRIGTAGNAAWVASITCTTCHTGIGDAKTGTGKILPFRHVNGTRDVVFDPRTAITAIGWLPAMPNTPAKPNWMSNAVITRPWPFWVVWNGTTVSYDFAHTSYDPATKSCSNVACHLAQTSVQWGRPFVDPPPVIGSDCTTCHN